MRMVDGETWHDGCGTMDMAWTWDTNGYGYDMEQVTGRGAPGGS